MITKTSIYVFLKSVLAAEMNALLPLRRIFVSSVSQVKLLSLDLKNTAIKYLHKRITIIRKVLKISRKLNINFR